MARKERSTYVKKRLIENATNELKNKARARQIYNYIYKKSKFFKTSIYIRSITIVFSIYIIYFNSIIISVKNEIVSDYKVEETHFTQRTDSRDHKSIYLTTTAANKYVIDLLKSKPDEFSKNDTIRVFKTVFGKKTYISKLKSENRNLLVALARCNNYLIFVTGFTLFSFLLKDGYDFFSRLILRSVLFFDLIGIVFYFLV